MVTSWKEKTAKAGRNTCKEMDHAKDFIPENRLAYVFTAQTFDFQYNKHISTCERKLTLN